MNQKLQKPDYSGLSLIPIEDGTKRPSVKWKEAQTEKKHFVDDAYAWAVVTGRVSGNLECLDIDLKILANDMLRETTWAEFNFMVNNELPELLAKITIQRTRNKGFHLFYRCIDFSIPGNHIISRNEKGETLFETRGEGGYVLVAPSDGYNIIQGDLNNVQYITIEERNCLMENAKKFNGWIQEETVQNKERVSDANSPWSHYNNEGDPVPVLQKHGWKVVDRQGVKVCLERPGKNEGTQSATWNNEGERWFYVFSSNAQPFEQEKAYRASQVFAMLECGNDWTLTASKLKSLGYGSSGLKSSIVDSIGNEVKIEDHQSLSLIDYSDGFYTEKDYDYTPELKDVQLLSFDVWNHKKDIEEPISVLTKTNMFLLVANQGFGKTSIMASISAQSFVEDRNNIPKIHFKLHKNVKRILYFDSELKDIDAKIHYNAMATRVAISKLPADVSLNDVGYNVETETKKIINDDGLKYFQIMKLIQKYPLIKIDAKLIIEDCIEKAVLENNPFDLIIIDDSSCLVENDENGVNNIDACKKASRWVNQIANKYNIGFICTLHGNPNDFQGTGKGRGHLGSELARFCETSINLSMDKDKELYKIVIGSAGKMRRGGIFLLHNNPLWYYFDDEKKMMLDKPCSFQPDSDDVKQHNKQERKKEKTERKNDIVDKINADIFAMLKQLESIDSLQVKQILSNTFPDYTKKTIQAHYAEWKQNNDHLFSIISRNGYPDTIKIKAIATPIVIPVTDPRVRLEPIKESLPLPEPDEFEKELHQSLNDIDTIDFDAMFDE